jgi:hypothetical protein
MLANVASWDSAFPLAGQGRLLQPRSISGPYSRSLLFRPTNSCLRFAMAVTGHHARLGTRLLAKLCRGRHSRRLGYMRFQGATRTDPCEPNSGTRLVWGFLCQGWRHTIFLRLVCSFFCSTRAASILPPRPSYCRRRRAQRGSRTALLQRRRRLVLDQREHGGKLPMIGWFATR